MKSILFVLAILSILFSRNVNGQTSDFECPGCCELSVDQNNEDFSIECSCPSECTCSSQFNCKCPDNCGCTGNNCP